MEVEVIGSVEHWLDRVMNLLTDQHEIQSVGTETHPVVGNPIACWPLGLLCRLESSTNEVALLVLMVELEMDALVLILGGKVTEYFSLQLRSEVEQSERFASTQYDGRSSVEAAPGDYDLLKLLTETPGSVLHHLLESPRMPYGLWDQ